jgi:hypothetical protein
MRVRSWVWGVVLAMSAAGADGVIAQGPGMSAAVLPAASTSTAPAVSTLTEPAASVAGVLRSLASRAGLVFVGQVQSIVPKAGVVEITFQVQQPVIGVVGGTYVLREWAGRWTGGQQRYRVGQRAMFFLHAPSAAGLSSPVDGMAGIVPLVPMGANAGSLLDVRMLATRVARPVGSPMVDAESGAIALADAETVVSSWQAEQVPEPAKLLLPVGVRPRPVTVQPERPVAASVKALGPSQPQEPFDAGR